MSRYRKTALFVGALAVPMVAGGFLLQSRSETQGPRLLDQVMGIVASRYVDTLPENDVFEKAARGLVRELNDPYSELLTPKDYKQFNSRTGGRYGGLGLLIEQDPVTKIVNIEKVYSNTPAAAGGGCGGGKKNQRGGGST